MATKKLEAKAVKKASPEELRRLKAIGAAQWLTPEDEKFLGEFRAAGWDKESLAKDFKNLPEIPKLEKPYTRLLAEINEKMRCHDQSTFGPDNDPKTNLCKTRMCTAGHLVNMAGEAGYKLLKALNGSFEVAALLIHNESCPDVPPQNFGAISQEAAMAYIEQRAAEEAAA